MCGIAGFWDTSASTSEETLINTANQMRDTLVHRGPDGADTWVHPRAGIALAHRRLAILDLSEHGQQPMHSHSKRYVIIFNGEIYNHQEIKQKLEGSNAAPKWRGHSDTEIILAAIDAWGVERALGHFVGMFAIVLWDSEQRLLYLIRDRIGEKPLYYGFSGDYLLFGSELKSLKAHFAWRQEIDNDALDLYMQFNYIPAPYSIYKNIFKVLPGHFLVVNQNKDVFDKAYWQLKDVIKERRAAPVSATAAIDVLEQKLKRTINQQMLADVPVGAFLSGGIDSSTVVALMQAQSSRPIKTFSIGFSESAYNEAQYAKQIAKHLQTDHTELYLSPEETMKIVPDMPLLYDEPFADSSQLPTLIVSKLTKQQVTVSLSGDGGDELFAGYNRYNWTTQLWDKFKLIPKPLRSIIAKLILMQHPNTWDKLFTSLNRVLPKRVQQVNPGEKLHKVAGLFQAKSLSGAYASLLSQWHTNTSEKLCTSLAKDLKAGSFIEIMMYIDAMRYLPDDILVKVDRAGMAVSLETRMPFLDHRIIEYVWSLPLAMKIHNGKNKWILRQLLNRYVPEELYDRPKMGFGVPIDQWMKGPLNEWAQTLLSKSMLNTHSLFDAKNVQKKWQEHLSGAGNWQHHLWNVLSFQAWYEAQHG